MPLVTNTTGQNLVARPRELPAARRRQVLARLAPRIGQPLSTLMAKVKAGDNQPLSRWCWRATSTPSSTATWPSAGATSRASPWRRRSCAPTPRATWRRTSSDPPARSPRTTSTPTGEKGYSGDETVGTDGVEQEYESVLKGTPGKSVVEVDASGEPQGREYISSQSPVPGRDLRLSIDSSTQGAGGGPGAGDGA